MGLLDSFNPDDPATMGLLSAAGSMFQASGPSLMPHTLGQVIGSGIQGGMAGYKSARDAARENTALQLQNAQLAQALRQGQVNQAIYEKLLAGMNGDSQGTADQSQAAPSAAQAALAQGATAGSLGPTTANAARMDLISAQPPQPVQPAPAPSSGGSMFGLNRNAMLGGMLAGPGELGKAIVAANAPTDLVRMMRAAGIDENSPLGRQIAQQGIAKQNYIAPTSLRPGGYVQNANGSIDQLPHVPDGYQAIKGANGQWNIVPVEGGVEALKTSAAAGQLGRTEGTLGQGVDGENKPTYFLGVPPGTVRSANPAAPTSSSSNLSQYQIPPAVQAQRDIESLKELQLERANPKNSAAGNAGLDREIANRMRTIAAAQAASGLSGSQGAQIVRPAAAPGFNASQEKLAGAGADRYIALLNQTADSPTRVNVYDNILSLSKQGVQTGPTADFWNGVKGSIASTPAIGKLFPGMRNDASNFQEINKFMYQNAQRNWQAAGGTGTDSQLDAFSKASPNSTMFPQALQAMAQWGKASELALQGKANAAQQWKDAQGGNVANQDQFERAWRNNFAPELYQLRTMDPNQAAQFVANMKKTNPTGYATLMMKAQALKNIGGL